MNGHVHGVDAVRVLRENLAEIEEGAVIARRIRERAGLPSEDGSVAEYREVVVAVFELIEADLEYSAARKALAEAAISTPGQGYASWRLLYDAAGMRLETATTRRAVALARVQGQEAGD